MSRGFTLVEVLVVLVIIGVVLGATLFTVRAGGEERLARDEIRRLDHIVGTLHDESVIRMAELGLRFHAAGYETLVWNGQDWIDYDRPRRWADVLRVELVVDGRPQTLASTPPSPGTPPQVVFLSSGEASAFTISIRAQDSGGERLTVGVTGRAEREVIEAR